MSCSLPFLDYDIIQKNPKLIVGYSDATALQLGIYTKTQILSLTGFNCSDIKAGKVDDKIWDSFLSCITQKSYSVNAGITVNPGVVKAPLRPISYDGDH